MQHKDNLIVKTTFGSYLYGTYTDQSDHDYKGVYIPPIRDCLLNRISKSIHMTPSDNTKKNGPDDIDFEIYSLQRFVNMLCDGEMVSLDMLHSPDSMVLYSTDIWQYIRSNRSMFYTKSLKGYLSYINKQCARYCIRGSRLNSLEKIIDLIESTQFNDDDRIELIWDKLPTDDHCRFVTTESKTNKTTEYYEFLGKRVESRVKISYLLDMARSTFDKYGKRAKDAANNDNLDWKAISHSIRVGLQLKEIYETGDLIFPLKDANYIRKIKLGEYHFINDGIKDKIEQMMTDVNEIASKSEFPEKVNRNKIDEMVLVCYEMLTGRSI